MSSHLHRWRPPTALPAHSGSLVCTPRHASAVNYHVGACPLSADRIPHRPDMYQGAAHPIAIPNPLHQTRSGPLVRPCMIEVVTSMRGTHPGRPRRLATAAIHSIPNRIEDTLGLERLVHRRQPPSALAAARTSSPGRIGKSPHRADFPSWSAAEVDRLPHTEVPVRPAVELAPRLSFPGSSRRPCARDCAAPARLLQRSPANDSGELPVGLLYFNIKAWITSRSDDQGYRGRRRRANREMTGDGMPHNMCQANQPPPIGSLQWT